MISYSSYEFNSKNLKPSEFGNWGIVRFTTFDDTDLCKAIDFVERNYGEIKEIVFMGNNVENVRIYQIIYKKI